MLFRSDETGKMDFASRRDAFCGKFSIMDVFCQYGLPFTVFEPHTVHPLSNVFASQLRDFAAVCRVVSGMKRFSVGALGARTTAFKTVRFDELTLQKYGITVEALDFSEVILRLNKLDKSDPRIASREERLKDYTNFSCCPASKLNLLAQVSVVIDDIIAHYRLDSIALRCWEEIEQLLGVDRKSVV